MCLAAGPGVARARCRQRRNDNASRWSVASVALLHFHNGISGAVQYRWALYFFFFNLKSVGCVTREVTGTMPAASPARLMCGSAVTRLHCSRTRCHISVAICSTAAGYLEVRLHRPEVAALLLCKYQVVRRVPKLSDTTSLFFFPRISTLSTWT